MVNTPTYCRENLRFASKRAGGFTFTELVIVIVMLGLFVVMTQLNIFSMLKQSKDKMVLQEFVNTMQMAVTSAAESDKRYEVIVDLAEQTYMLRQISTPDLSNVLEEEIITEGTFSDDCWVSYVEFDDGDYTTEATAKFRAGRSGWQYGGKVVFENEDGQYFSVVLNRISRLIRLEDDDVQIMEPKRKDEVFF